MKWLFIVLPALFLSACATYSLNGLSPSTQVYAIQREFNEIYLPPIVNYANKDFCDVGASPPVVTNCSDAKTVITLNTIAQETGNALTVAQGAVRAADAACATPVEGEVDVSTCTDKTKILAASVQALRVVLARVSTEFVKAGLDK